MKYKNKSWMERKYSREELSAIKIAKLCGTSSSTIYRWLKRLNIDVRSVSEAWKGKLHYRYGRNIPKEVREKISESLKGRERSKDVKRKISKSLKGKYFPSPNRKICSHKGIKHSEETKRKISEAKKGVSVNKGKFPSLETRMKMSEVKKGKMPVNFEYTNIYNHIRRGYYNINGKEIFLRSKWEANYALYLDFLIKQKQIKKWEYEAETFMFEEIKLGVRSYTPDFKIINNDNSQEYHEVKGWMDPKSKTKIKRMAKYYPK